MYRCGKQNEGALYMYMYSVEQEEGVGREGEREGGREGGRERERQGGRKGGRERGKARGRSDGERKREEGMRERSSKLDLPHTHFPVRSAAR